MRKLGLLVLRLFIPVKRNITNHSSNRANVARSQDPAAPLRCSCVYIVSVASSLDTPASLKRWRNDLSSLGPLTARSPRNVIKAMDDTGCRVVSSYTRVAEVVKTWREVQKARESALYMRRKEGRRGIQGLAYQEA